MMLSKRKRVREMLSNSAEKLKQDCELNIEFCDKRVTGELNK